MILLNPLALWLFGLGGLVILIYFLRKKAQIYEVSALFLWQAILKVRQSAFYMIKQKIWLLLLQLLALSLLIFGLTNPAAYIQAEGGRKIAIIIDGSASMQTIVNGKTKYEAAIAKAASLIKKTHEVMLIQAQKKSKLLSPLTKDKDALIQRLYTSKPTFQGDGTLADLISLIESQAPLEELDRVFYITDRFIKAPKFEIIPLEGGENVAITNFVVRQQPNLKGYSILVEVANYTSQEVETDLVIKADEEPIISERIQLDGGEKRMIVFYHQGRETKFVATIDINDDLKYDNTRYFAFPLKTFDVLMKGEPDPYLQMALVAAGSLLVEEGPADLIVANNTVISAGPRRILLINSSFPPLVEVAQAVPAEEIEVLEDHPVLEGVEVGNIEITRVRAFEEKKEEGEVILFAGEPVLWLYYDDKIKIAYLGFDLGDSNIVWTVDFPILIRNLLVWLLELERDLGGFIEVGDGVFLSDPIKFTDPQGKTYFEDFLRADLPGFYTVFSERGTYWWAANPPASESIIEKGEEVEPVKIKAAEKTDSIKKLWRYPVILGMLILLLELFYYDSSPFRRK